MTAYTDPQPQLPLGEPRTGIRLRTPRRDAPEPVIYVDSSFGDVLLDITDHHGNRVHLQLRADEARTFAAVLERHVTEGRY